MANINGQAGTPTDAPVCLNVMQEIVEEKADKYMGKANMCCCPRCRIDVIALTLSRLPSKYVVVPSHERLPMVSVYEERYSTSIISNLMWACERVRDNPRHDDGEQRVAFCR